LHQDHDIEYEMARTAVVSWLEIG